MPEAARRLLLGADWRATGRRRTAGGRRTDRPVDDSWWLSVTLYSPARSKVVTRPWCRSWRPCGTAPMSFVVERSTRSSATQRCGAEELSTSCTAAGACWWCRPSNSSTWPCPRGRSQPRHHPRKGRRLERRAVSWEEPPRSAAELSCASSLPLAPALTDNGYVLVRRLLKSLR